MNNGIALLIIALGVLTFRQERAIAQILVSEGVEESTTQKLCPNDLPAAIEAVINRQEYKRSQSGAGTRSHWGILVQPLTSSDSLYSLNAQRYFIPASNVKLFTTAAALLQFGSQYRIRTSVYSDRLNPNLTSLRIVGKGDPSLTNVQLQALAHQLKGQGINQVQQLIVDDSYFQESAIHPTWEWEDIFFYYGVSVNSLILNENAVTLELLPQELGQPAKLNWSDPIAARQWQVENQAVSASEETPYSVEINGVLGKSVLNIKGELAIDSPPDIWGLAVVDPAHYFLDSLKQILLLEGITVNQGFVNKNFPETSSLIELAAIESPSLSILIQTTNQESNNLYAEALRHILGSESEAESGVEAIKEILTELGVDRDSYHLADGSGLSRHNLVSPQAVVQTLKLMAQTPEASIYKTSLPIAGVSGTLQRRFRDTHLQGNLQAKTGTLTGVSALSGYLNNQDYQTLVFSIIVNQSDRSATNIRQGIDEIVLLLSNVISCRN